MTCPRKSLIDATSTPYYHCMARCVRRAFLCGKDHVTGQDYAHRKQWVVDRLNALASVFAIDVCAYAVMSNHYHVVLHINTDVAGHWRTDEVLRRWTQLFNGPLLVQRYLAGDSLDKAALLRVNEYAALYRARLQDISWFMRCLNEHLAREANKEDGCQGRFWEGRFKSQALLDEAALLTCMAYVDLNPVRANIAETPETSDYTSVQARLRQVTASLPPPSPRPNLKPFRSTGQNPENTIPFTLQDYLELVDWTGRSVRADKRGSIVSELPSILVRLAINPDEWLKTMRWDNRFYRAVGNLAAMRTYAESQGKRWLQGLFSSARLYHC